MIALYVVLGLVVWAGIHATRGTPPPQPVEHVAGMGGGTVLLVLIGVAVVGLCSRGAHHAGRSRDRGHTSVVRHGRTIEVHTGPNSARTVAKRRSTAADHEAGHVAVAKARGWKVTGAEVHDDGSGVTRLHIPWTRRYDPRDDIAVSLAGGKAARTWSGCGSDMEYATAARDSYPDDQRDAAWREGNRRTDSALFWRGGQRRRDSAALQRDGAL